MHKHIDTVVYTNLRGRTNIDMGTYIHVAVIYVALCVNARFVSICHQDGLLAVAVVKHACVPNSECSATECVREQRERERNMSV